MESEATDPASELFFDGEAGVEFEEAPFPSNKSPLLRVIVLADLAFVMLEGGTTAGCFPVNVATEAILRGVCAGSDDVDLLLTTRCADLAVPVLVECPEEEGSAAEAACCKRVAAAFPVVAVAEVAFAALIRSAALVVVAAVETVLEISLDFDAATLFPSLPRARLPEELEAGTGTPPECASSTKCTGEE